MITAPSGQMPKVLDPIAAEITRREIWCLAHGAVAVCTCHRPWRGFTAAEWQTLELVGLQGPLELRNCPCGSTISRML